MYKHKKANTLILNMTKRYLRYIGTYLPLLVGVGVFIAILLMSNCAQIEPLQGGPIDSIAPQLVSSTPLHESTGFKGRKIKLIFDKEIEIRDVYNKLIITPKLPRLESGPSYICKARGNTLDLNLETELEDNTTYTFNFKDAICDTKEGTPAENPTLTFSTGDYVDSLYIAGQVKFLMTDQPVKDGLVAIYKIADADSLHILNTTPDYFTKANENGEFKLEHIKQGTYRICAGYSKENKLILDPSKEPYGFLPSLIDLQESVDDINLYIVEANINDFKIQNKQPQGQYFEINFSKPVNNYTLTLAHQSKRFKDAQLYSHLSENKLTITVYNTLGLLEDDRLEAKLTAEDDMENMIAENIIIHFRDRLQEKGPFKYTITPIPGTKVDPALFKAEIKLTKPIKRIELDKIMLVVGQVDSFKLDADEVTIHPHKDLITIQKAFNPTDWLKISEGKDDADNEKSSNITLSISKGAFVSVEKETNEVTESKYLIKHKQECGTIKGRVISHSPGFIIQLLDEEYKVVEEIRNQFEYEFKDILPGNYKIRVLALQKKDGKWHFGNINIYESPDKVAFYPHALPIVANWEIDYIDIEI
jgi:hypothetical protein